MKFYKYMSRSTAELVLKNRTLRWSTPGKLNDPYDMQFDLHIEVDQDKVTLLALDKLWTFFYENHEISDNNMLGTFIKQVRARFPKMTRQQFNMEFGSALRQAMENGLRRLPEVQKETRLLLNKCKILCLSDAPDLVTMWTHYAENHQGIALQFRCIPQLDSPWKEARPVNYVENMPRLVDEQFLSDLLAGNGHFEPKEIINRLIYTKSTDWSLEREWRICFGTGRNSDATFEDLPFHPLELGAIIFGFRMPKEDQKKFIGTAQQAYPNAQLLRVERDEKSFKLFLREIERETI